MNTLEQCLIELGKGLITKEQAYDKASNSKALAELEN